MSLRNELATHMEDAPESHRPPKDMRAECIKEIAKVLVKLLSI